MSNRYKGGVISATPPTTTGGESGTASGAWTLEQQMQLTAAGLWPIQPLPKYIEDVFSTYLYTGNNTVQTITNGIDLSTKGGAVIIKSRNLTGPTVVYDTNRGINKALCANLTNAENVGTLGTNQDLNSFNTNGFSVNLFTNAGGGLGINNSAHNLASWTFREQAKFFDVLTYTGNGTSGRTIAHNLGSVPGCIIVKAYSVDTGDYWGVYHRSLGATKAIFLSATNAAATSSTYWNDTEPTSTNFTVGDWSGVNQNGTSYVAYLFAHDAGGFGLTGTDNVISCGSFTTDGSGLFSVTLGYEPQWVMVKRSSGVGDWIMFDTMRGMPTAAASGVFSATLFANTTAAEDAAGGTVGVNATGFNSLNGYLASSSTFIYIAIRKGPMAVPTVGTSVFSPIAYVGANGAAQNISAGFPVDMDIIKMRNNTSNPLNHARLMGGVFLSTNTTGAQQSYSDNIVSFSSAQNVIGLPVTGGGTNEINGASTSTYIAWAMRRAPSFFDEVCYTGTGATRTINHNLGVVPEFMIIKGRTGSPTYNWICYHNSFASNQVVELNTTTGVQNNGGAYDISTLSSTVFGVKTGSDTNGNTNTYVAYLFATCAGVSKVGSYTGTGTILQVDCGFTAGSRFVMIKRTDSTGDWYVWDSARGIVAGNDPYLLMNSTAAEVTGTDYVDTYSAGFEISSTAPAAINANGGTFIFLAIA